MNTLFSRAWILMNRKLWDFKKWIIHFWSQKYFWSNFFWLDSLNIVCPNQMIDYYNCHLILFFPNTSILVENRLILLNTGQEVSEFIMFWICCLLIFSHYFLLKNVSLYLPDTHSQEEYFWKFNRCDLYLM